jgi:AcrR family transcriptional regulator
MLLTREAISARKTDPARREKILSAAFECFIRHGYAKVGVNDIAVAAGISRPLLYLLFDSKEDIFLSMFVDIFDDQIRRARAAAALRHERKDKIESVFQVVYLETWSKLKTAPEDLIDAAERLFPKVGNKYWTEVRSILATAVGSAELAEVLILSVKGLSHDRPSTGVLRKRIKLLIARFI